jgi:hypothetical protein
MSCSRPADQVVYLIDPLGTAPLAKADGYANGVTLTAAQTASPLVHVPAVPDATGMFKLRTGAIFLHERRTPIGDQRIVSVVPMMFEHDDGQREVILVCRVWLPAGIIPPIPMQAGPRRTPDESLAGIGKLQTLQLYAGQPDPEDWSRFTIEFDLDGTRGQIIGRLTNDDFVDLKVKNWPGVFRPGK